MGGVLKGGAFVGGASSPFPLGGAPSGGDAGGIKGDGGALRRGDAGEMRGDALAGDGGAGPPCFVGGGEGGPFLGESFFAASPSLEPG